MTEQERIEALLEALEEVSAKRHSGADAIGMIAELSLQRDRVAKRAEELEKVDGVTWLGERGDAIWAHAAAMIGFNELAKIQPTLSGKMYCRMLRRAAEEALIALGCGPKLIMTTLVLEIPMSRPELKFLPSDIELMRQEVARHDAETGGLTEPPPLAPTHDEPNVGGDWSTYCDVCGDEVSEPHSLLVCAQELRRQRDHLRDHLVDLEARKLEDPLLVEAQQLLPPGALRAALRIARENARWCGDGADGESIALVCDAAERTLLPLPELPLPAAQGGLYVASKVRHASMWLSLRASGVDIISTWIDEEGPGLPEDMGELYERCLREAASCSDLLCYSEFGDLLKGALVEVGAALSHGRRVWWVGPRQNVCAHPLVTVVGSVEEALARRAVAPR